MHQHSSGLRQLLSPFAARPHGFRWRRTAIIEEQTSLRRLRPAIFTPYEGPDALVIIRVTFGNPSVGDQCAAWLFPLTDIGDRKRSLTPGNVAK